MTDAFESYQQLLESRITSLQKLNTELTLENRLLKDEKGLISRLQAEHKDWQFRNFPNNTADQNFLGVVEEVGELAHAMLKQQQGIRGSEEKHEADAKDAVGDIFIFLLGFCSLRGYDCQDIILSIWKQVSQRDWNKDKLNGGIKQD